MLAPIGSGADARTEGEKRLPAERVDRVDGRVVPDEPAHGYERGRREAHRVAMVRFEDTLRGERAVARSRLRRRGSPSPARRARREPGLEALRAISGVIQRKIEQGWRAQGEACFLERLAHRRLAGQLLRVPALRRPVGLLDLSSREDPGRAASAALEQQNLEMLAPSRITTTVPEGSVRRSWAVAWESSPHPPPGSRLARSGGKRP